MLDNWIQHVYSVWWTGRNFRTHTPVFSLAYIYLATYLATSHVNMINQIVFIPEIQV